MTILRDAIEIREICEDCVQKYDKVTRKARRGNKEEFNRLLALVFKASKHRADPECTASILKETLLCSAE